MSITGPEEIKFVNEYIRPMCETIRYMKVRGDDFALKWAGISGSFPADATPVEDGREGEGVSRLTGEDINSVAVLFNILLGDIGTREMAVVAKPCVRPLLYNPSE
jgi:hypothetical protein